MGSEFVRNVLRVPSMLLPDIAKIVFEGYLLTSLEPIVNLGIAELPYPLLLQCSPVLLGGLLVSCRMLYTLNPKQFDL